MKHPFLSLPVLLLMAPLANGRGPELSSFVAAQLQPVFFGSNAAALSARLKLADSASSGDRVRIATFAFENGVSTRQLVRHLCLAARRGVRVELLIDSKYGSRPGLPDVFDKSPDKQVAEEMLQYLANCGASVYVHNQQTSYVELFGSRVPNFFLDPAMEGRSLGFGSVFKVIRRVNELAERAEGLVEAEAKRAGLSVDVHPLLKRLRNLLIRFVLFSMGSEAEQPGSALGTAWEKLLREPIWAALPAAELRALLPGIEASFRGDPVFSRLIELFRHYNRLSHRKLFLVEKGDGSQGCLIIGGRNLGDHYLADSAHSYFDGDVQLCRHHGGSSGTLALNEAGRSFERLLEDRTDPFLGDPGSAAVLRLSADPSFVFRHLHVPPSMRLPGHREARGSRLPLERRSLLPERRWRDAAPVAATFALSEAEGFEVLLSGWNRKEDPIRQRLLAGIREERSEIYLETPYAEFDEELRSALEAALSRGVRLQLITNSLLSSDGGSKAIRLLMMRWTERMIERFPGRFDAHFTTFGGGHMTHFKAAAFGCQSQGDRYYLVGSHNFHPRSGHADKEIMLGWREGGCRALSQVSLVRSRHHFYNDFARRERKRVLARYRNLLEEMQAAVRLYRPGEEAGQRLALGVRGMLYEEYRADEWRLREPERLRRLLELVDESGLHDLLGRVL